MTGPEPDGGHSVRIAAVVVARIAANRATTVDGVAALRPGRNRSLVALVGRLAPASGRDAAVVDGVTARVDGAKASVDLDIAVPFGAACVEVVSRVQREVVAAVRRETGLESTVAVDIVDIVDIVDVLGDRRGPGTAP